MMAGTNDLRSGEKILPSPITALGQFYRVLEAGTEERKYIGLDRNVRVSPFPEWFMAKIRENIDSSLFNNYPVQDQLQIKLASYLNVSTDSLLITPSSDAAFQYLYHAYVSQGDEVVMLDPSYAMFPVYADMFEAKPVLIPFDRDITVDNVLLINSISNRTKMVLIANPNQPTGTLLPESVLLTLINRAAEVNALVVVDEAYYPFSHSTLLPMVVQYPNLVVTRTFSKAGGLAGCRIGYIVGHPEIINQVYKVRSVNDLNSMAILCVNELLEYPEVIDQYVADTEEGSSILQRDVRELGLEPLPTHANFALIRVGHICDPNRLVESLKLNGYLVKGSLPECVDDCIRVTLGPADVMRGFVTALRKSLEMCV